jgi:hypothetical protein
VAFDLEELHKEKSKKKFVIGYGAMIDHFKNGNPIIVYCQSLHAFFYCRKLVVEAINHTSKSPSCVSKPQSNGSTCHPFIGV